MGLERIVLVVVPALAIYTACGNDDARPDAAGGMHAGGAAGSSGSGAGGAASTCPGAAIACPAGCQTQMLPALTPGGCLVPQVASCTKPPPPVTLDAGCVKRDADNQLFHVPTGGWQNIGGFEECTSQEQGMVLLAAECSD